MIVKETAIQRIAIKSSEGGFSLGILEKGEHHLGVATETLCFKVVDGILYDKRRVKYTPYSKVCIFNPRDEIRFQCYMTVGYICYHEGS